jgi:hypothetical protein
MTASHQDLRTGISDSLKQVTTRLKVHGNGSWTFCLRNGAALAGSAHLANAGWLCLDIRLPEEVQPPLSASGRAWDLLCWNAGIEGGGKLAIVQDGYGKATIRLRAEIPLDEDSVPAERIGQVCSGFQRVSRKLCGKKRKRTKEGSESLPTNQAEGGARRDSGDLRQRCAEAGWEFTERPDGRLFVALDVQDDFCQAVVEEDGNRGVRVSVELVGCEALPEPCREATGLLLLRCCAIVRMARAAAEQSNQRVATRLEVVFPGSASSAELSHALAALSVGSHLCRKEVNALQDEAMAREYLSVRGLSS